MSWMLFASLVACSGDPPSSTLTTAPPTLGDDPILTADTATIPGRLNPWDCYGQALLDRESNGRIDLYTYLVYDPQRRDLLIHEEVDEYDDGRLERQTDHVYDAHNNEIQRIEDADGDGLADEITAWIYDDADRLIGLELDADGDGLVDRVESWVYDDQGRLLLEEIDADADGTPDKVTDYLYLDDRIETAHEDSDGDGTTDRVYTYGYDPDGALASIEGARTSDGAIVYLATWLYPDPQTTVLLEDSDGDGTIELRLSETRDASGRLVDQWVDALDDGFPELSWEGRTYDDDDRFRTGRLFLDATPGSAGGEVFYDFDLTYAEPSGPWIDVETVAYRATADSDPYRIDTTGYTWSCPGR